jgi:transposase
MHSHPNTRLTQKSRLRLVNQHLQDRRPLAELAAEAGISHRTAYKWLARFRSGGAAALVDRRSVPRTQQRKRDPSQQQQDRAPRHERCTIRRIAKVLTAPLSKVRRWLKAIGLGRMRNLEPREPVRRKQWAQPGNLIHVDTTRLTYVEVLPDEQKATTVGFLVRSVSRLNSQGITCRRVLCDTISAYRTRQWRHANAVLRLKAKRTKAYRPQNTVKAEGYGIRPMYRSRAGRLGCAKATRVWTHLSQHRFE